MKLLLAATVVFLLAINPVVRAETKPDPGSFAAFWVRFKEAVAKENKEAIAGMTKFPFDDGSGKQLSRADFIKQSGAIFDQKTRKCFRSAKPVKEDNRDSYSVFCGEVIFVFAKGNGGYQFTALGVND
ncbi:MAG: hypothetical protein V7609_1434 [Verrucomicrobiota bacterium]